MEDAAIIKEPEPTTSKFLRIIITIAAVVTFFQLLGVSMLFYTKFDSLVMRAVIGMMLVVIAVWVVMGGILALRYRSRIRAWVLRLPGPWQLKFVIFATVMALLEEVCTVTMTNCAPLFGVKVGEAYITASANYLDVVALHSVVVFIPQYIAWAWLLTKYNLSPAAVFLLYGIQGIIGETLFGGPSHLLEVFWIFIYGLMVYLPAYCIPMNRGAKKVDFGIIPYFLVVLISPGPVAALVMKIHPVKIHFPPINP